MSLYSMVQEQMKIAFSYLEAYDECYLNYLLEPDRVLSSSLDLVMDDGSTNSFQAFRSQHNNIK